MSDKKIIIESGGIILNAILFDSTTSNKIIDRLPITSLGNRWGDEIYFPINISDQLEDGASDLFNSGIRPALNTGLSVSRVGSSAQTKAMKKVAGSLKIELAQFRELASFAQFGSDDLDEVTKRQLQRGQRLQEILKQPQYSPVTVENQVSMLYLASKGYLDDIDLEKILEFEKVWVEYASNNIPGVMKGISETGELSGENEKEIDKVISDCKKMFTAG